ncbi:hypothetical protein ACLI4Z_11000 [Natrialbaceae archaeon A-arb3/5]
MTATPIQMGPISGTQRGSELNACSWASPQPEVGGALGAPRRILGRDRSRRAVDQHERKNSP